MEQQPLPHKRGIFPVAVEDTGPLLSLVFGNLLAEHDRAGHLPFLWQAWPFLHVSDTSAGMGENERCFWKSCCGAGAIFRELE